jgi:hypothetical protein
MSDFQRQTLETVHKGEVRLAGGFRPNGSSTPTAFYGNWISSVALTSTGLFTVTLKNPYKGLRVVGKNYSLQLSAAADTVLQWGTYDASAGTIQVRSLTAGSVANIAANADNIIWLELVVKYSIGVPDGGPNYDS